MNIVKVTAVLLAAHGVAFHQENWEERLAKARISIVEAIDRGQKLAGEGFLYEAELEEDKGALVYSLDIAQGDKTRNVVIDASSGKVVENAVEDGDHSQEAKACTIDLKRAVEAAAKKSGGKPVHARILLQEGKAVFSVKVVARGNVEEIRVDAASGLVSGDAPKPAAPAQDKFTDVFPEDKADLASTGTNPYFVLEAGYVLTFEGKEDGKDIKLVITVLDETKKIDGVETRIVEERETENGEPAEISRNYFVISKKTNSVYYFGEDVDIYKNGKVVAHEGSWHSGEKGARYGMMMPGIPLIGARFHQEVAPEIAMDRAEIQSLTEKLEAPAGKFENVLKIEETTPLEKDKAYKYYAKGVGLVQDGVLKLVKYGKK